MIESSDKSFTVWIDHAYEGEKQANFATLADAVAYANEARRSGVPVKGAGIRVGDELGDSVCEDCGSIFGYDSATQESVCLCGKVLA